MIIAFIIQPDCYYYEPMQYFVPVFQHPQYIIAADSQPVYDVNQDYGIYNETVYTPEATVFPVEINGTVYYSDPSKSSNNVFENNDIFELFSSMKTPMEELIANGYPYFDNRRTKMVTIEKTKYDVLKKWIDKDEKIRTCSRCNEDYELEKNGTGEYNQCINHRNCCGEIEGDTKGCQADSKHIHNQWFAEELGNFTSTARPTHQEDPRSRSIYALDCEMVSTLEGLALARLSVVNSDGNLALDVRVKPPTKVVDPMTEFSGLTLEDIETAEDDLQSCQQKFFELVNSKTVLIGHSLESDLKALRLVHYNIIDTAILYKTGKNKPALKMLASKILGKSIQSENPDTFGHDSEEDARTICSSELSTEILQTRQLGDNLDWPFLGIGSQGTPIEPTEILRTFQFGVNSNWSFIGIVFKGTPIGKSIRSENPENFGEDSEEDARTCIDLIEHRIAQS
ncbi:unnamed protein product [Caenorhabditis angaria]|uniref:Exonuclease domain-containing protein n=1 Tax=Caenorhabditis angaria TaxID=860376 RepID=A0A9P1IZ63_9PELO|nr:unnamed protein product [Caenorhabditis angaria]